MSPSEPSHRRPAGELVIPPAALSDPRSVEMIRVWIAARGCHCAINVGHWTRNTSVREEHAWGLMLADVIRHLANALHAETGASTDDTIHRVLSALQVELDHPTSEHPGGFVE